jgi:hypothetical protein
LEVTMTDPDDREAGFYWISIDGQEVEVAQWQTEWSRWLVTGSGMPLADEWSGRVLVLSDRLPPPAVLVSRQAAAE